MNNTANEYLVTAEGWSQFDVPEKDATNQDRLDFSHDIAKTFSSTEGKKVLTALVSRFLLSDIVTAHETQFGAGIKQGQANVVKQLLAHIEISNNS